MKKIFVVVLLLLSGIGLLSAFYFLSHDTQLPISLNADNIATPFPSIPTSNEPSSVTFVFTGDTMLDRNIRLKAQQQGYDFLIGPKLKNIFASAEYVLTNLEGPVTSSPSVSVGSEVGSTRNFIFTFDPEGLKFLKRNNINVVNLGNNHILNFGTEGLAETYQYLDQTQLLYFGYTGTTQPERSSTLILQTDQGSVGLVNYNQFISGGENQVFTDIEALKNSVDYLIVYTHWGNEYVQENKVLVDLAHRFIDEGVDLVIGSHPHIITGHEIYKDKHIYYSLGNFIFDQYFDENVKKGMIVIAQITPHTKETVVSEEIVEINPNGQTELQ